MKSENKEKTNLRFEFVFRDVEQRDLVRKAAEHAGMTTLRAWVISVLMAAARRELSECD